MGNALIKCGEWVQCPPAFFIVLMITVKPASLRGRDTILRTKASIINNWGGKPCYSCALRPLDLEMVQPIQEPFFFFFNSESFQGETRLSQTHVRLNDDVNFIFYPKYLA